MSWKELPATEKQLEFLRKRKGLEISTTLTRGEASEQIEKLEAAATHKQLEWLDQNGVAYSLEITFNEASDLIEKTILDSLLSLADLERFDSRAPSGNKTERRFCCPLCGVDKLIDREHRSIAVNTQDGRWLCHRCKEGGILREHYNPSEKPLKLSNAARSRAEAMRRFALPERKSPAPKLEPTPEEIEKATRWREAWEASTDLAGTRGAVYIEGRSIPLELAIDAGVRYSPEWYGRPAVLFPVRDRAGELVAVSGRFINGREDPKTMTGGHKSGGVFCAMPGTLEARCLAICEGQFDALALSACGIPAIALIGTSWPDWLPRALAFRSVLIATDADKAGDDAAAKLGPALSSRGAHTLRLKPKGAKDWGEELESGKLEFLSMWLRGFSSILQPMIADDYLSADVEPLTADDLRICAARDLAEAGRIDAAMFITRLLDDQALRTTVSLQVEGLFNEANAKASVNSGAG